MVALTYRRVGLIYKPQLLAITLVLVITLGVLLQGMDLPSFVLNSSLLSFIQNAFGDPREKIVHSLTESSLAQNVI
jgi:hypothetical protein